MLTRIKTLFKANSLIIALSITFVIAYLSLMKVQRVNYLNISFLDKIEHAIAYCALGFSWLFAVSKVTITKNKKITVVLSCVIYGIIIEVFQMTFTSYRTASFLDIIANSIGVVIALLIFNKVYRKFKAI